MNSKSKSPHSLTSTCDHEKDINSNLSSSRDTDRVNITSSNSSRARKNHVTTSGKPGEKNVNVKTAILRPKISTIEELKVDI